jgi:hypothetical protein
LSNSTTRITRRATLGLVKLRVKRTLLELNTLFLELFARGNRDVRVEAGFVGEAEDEIDRLFGTL